VLAPAALVGLWASTSVTETSSYVDTVGPLAEDPAVQGIVADEVERAIVFRYPASETAGPLVRRATVRVVSGPEFPPAWREANRVVHRDLVAVMEGERRPDVDELGRVRLDLVPVAEAVLATLGDQGSSSLPRCRPRACRSRSRRRSTWNVRAPGTS